MIGTAMIQAADSVILSVPRNVLADIVKLSDGLIDRMHDLLERNTDGALASTEKAELETLVHMAQFGQIITLALQSKPTT